MFVFVNSQPVGWNVCEHVNAEVVMDYLVIVTCCVDAVTPVFVVGLCLVCCPVSLLWCIVACEDGGKHLDTATEKKHRLACALANVNATMGVHSFSCCAWATPLRCFTQRGTGPHRGKPRSCCP